MDFPFKEDMINKAQGSSYNFEYSNGSINKTKGCYTGGLLATKQTFDLNQPWALRFEYKWNSVTSDWEHIFSFGTHYGFGGDDAYICIYYRNYSAGATPIIKSDYPEEWNTYKLIYDGTRLYGYINNINKYNEVFVCKNVNGLYFSGAGTMKQLNADIKNFVFNLGDVYLPEIKDSKDKLHIY